MNFELRQVVLDTSVVIKWVRSGEEDREQALQLRKNYLEGELAIAIPDLLLYELANVLRFKPSAVKENVRKVVNSFLDLGLAVIEPSPVVLHEAIELSFEYDVTFYDALFLAIAENLRYDFVTADQALYRQISQRGGAYLLSTLQVLK